MKVLLIADSPDFDLALVKRLAESHDRIVVLDGAAAKVRGVINPHLICGDFDSLDVEMAKTWYPGAEFLSLPDQYKNRVCVWRTDGYLIRESLRGSSLS
jgi:thiamine pyrophosphokinase